MAWAAWVVTIFGGSFFLGIAIASWIKKNKHPKDAGTFEDLQAWDKSAFPFTVVLYTEPPAPEYLGHAVSAAVSFWRDVHPGLFAPYGELVEGGKVITIMPLSSLEGDKAELCSNRFGYTRLTLKDGALWGASVYIDTKRMEFTPWRVLFRAIAHELGHCLGLAHDEDGGDEDSVMEPVAAADSHPVVTVGDRATLLALYG